MRVLLCSGCERCMLALDLKLDPKPWGIMPWVVLCCLCLCVQVVLSGLIMRLLCCVQS